MSLLFGYLTLACFILLAVKYPLRIAGAHKANALSYEAARGCERGLSAVRAYTRFLHLQGFSDPRRVAAGHGGCGAPDEPCAYICMSHDQRYQEENVLAPLVFACSAYVYRAAYGAVFYIIYLYKISR